MSKQTIIYQTRSFKQDVQLFFLRVVLIAAMVYFIWMYDENPILLGILAGICFLFFVSAGSNNIVISSEKIIFKNDSILNLFLKRETYMLKDIRHFIAEGNYKQAYFTTKKHNYNFNTIKLFMANGEMIHIETSVYIDQLKKAAAVVNELVGKR